MMAGVATPRIAFGMEQVSSTKKNQTKIATAIVNAVTPAHTLIAKGHRNHLQQASWYEPLMVLRRLTRRRKWENATNYAVHKPKDGYVDQPQQTESSKT